MRVKKGLRGQTKRPLPNKKALDAVRPRVPVTLCQTEKGNQIPKQEGTNPPPSEGLPLALARARGRDIERPGPAVGRAIGGPSSKTCEAAKQKGKTKNQGREATKHPLPGESQKRAGPRMAHRRKRQEAGRTAKKGETTSAAGQKNRNNKHRCVWGVSCYYLSVVSWKEKQKQNDVGENLKRTNPKTANLTSPWVSLWVSGCVSA